MSRWKNDSYLQLHVSATERTQLTVFVAHSQREINVILSVTKKNVSYSLRVTQWGGSFYSYMINTNPVESLVR